MSSTFAENFRNKLEEIRFNRKWSIAELAQKCGLPKSTVDGYLKGVTPGLDAIEKVSKGTGISVAGLLVEWTSVHGDRVDFIKLAAKDELKEFFETQIRRANAGRKHDLLIKDQSIGGVSAEALAESLALEISQTAQGLQQTLDIKDQKL